jgi:membrane-associated protease RseP (regulator of RpoE activity)
LNLIPASQLDGGHIAYALFGRRQARLSAGVVLLLFVIGLLAALPLSSGEPTWGGVMWIVWAILLFVIGVRHPEVADEQRPLTGPERAAGWLSLVVFVATFVPVPVTVLAEPRQGAPGFELPVDERDEPTGASPAEEFRL